MSASLTAPKILNVGPAFTGSNTGLVKTIRVTVGAAGADVIVDGQHTYQALSVPAGVWVLDVVARVITAFSTSVTITVGDTNAANGYFTSTVIAPQTADSVGIGKACSINAMTYSGGRKYLSADNVVAVIGGATPAAGLLELEFKYVDGTAGTA